MANHDKGDKSIHLLPAFNIWRTDAGFFPFSSIYMEMCFHSEDVLRLMKNLIGCFEGGGRKMKYLERFLFVS